MTNFTFVACTDIYTYWYSYLQLCKAAEDVIEGHADMMALVESMNSQR